MACGRWWWEKVGRGDGVSGVRGLEREAAESSVVAP